MNILSKMLRILKNEGGYIKVELGPTYFPQRTIGRPISNAQIYVGDPDTDPEVVGNQISLFVQEEDGTIVEVTQPIRTNAGGTPIYDSSPVTLLVASNYSLKVLDSTGVQVYYIPSTDVSTYNTILNHCTPNYLATDQGLTGESNTVKFCVDTINTSEGTIFLRHNSGGATTTYTFSTNETIPVNINLEIEKGAKMSIDAGVTLTIEGFFGPGLYQVVTGDGNIQVGTRVKEIHPHWFGAVVDGSTNDAAAWNKAFGSVDVSDANESGATIIVPAGTSVVNDSIDVPGNGRWIVRGHGDVSIIEANGPDAFTLASDGNTHSVFEHFRMQGDNTAGKAAFNCTPDDPLTEVCTGVKWQHLRITGFKIAFNVPNTQLCFWEHISIAFTVTGCSVFYMNTSGVYSQSNSNNVTESQFTGADAQVYDFTFTAGQNRATTWVLKDTEIQFSGTTIPITIQDVGYIVDNCGFENSTADNLIDIVCTDDFVPHNIRIENNTFTFTPTGATAPVNIRRTGAVQYPAIININNNSWNPALNIVDIGDALQIHIEGNQGKVNNTGGRVITEINNSDTLGTVRMSSVNTASDMLLVGTEIVAGANTGGYTRVFEKAFYYQTTNANATNFIIHNLAEGEVATVFVTASAWNTTDDNAWAGYMKRATAYRAVAGAATLLGTDEDIGTDNETTVGWDLGIGVNGNDIIVIMTGEAAKDINWGFSVKLVVVNDS